MQTDDSMQRLDQTALLEAMAAMAGSDCEGESEGDWRDSEGLLVCHKCGKRKERRADIPLLGIRVHPCMCDCQKAEYEREEAARKQMDAQRSIDDLFRYSLIDERFKGSTFANFRKNEYNQKPYTIAMNYVAKFSQMLARNKGLLFYGEPGTGKTFLASCIANALLEQRVPLIVTSIIKLTSATGPFSREAEEQQELLQKMNDAMLLVIDDLGTERATDYKMEQVFEVIDSRYGAKKPMIVTTNLTLDQMQSEPDLRRRRIFERIYEVCFPVKFTGPSWRRETAADDYDEIKQLLTERI